MGREGVVHAAIITDDGTSVCPLPCAGGGENDMTCCTYMLMLCGVHVHCMVC